MLSNSAKSTLLRIKYPNFEVNLKLLNDYFAEKIESAGNMLALSEALDYVLSVDVDDKEDIIDELNNYDSLHLRTRHVLYDIGISR